MIEKYTARCHECSGQLHHIINTGLDPTQLKLMSFLLSEIC